METLGLPDSPGVPADLAKHTLTAPYNDLPALAKLFEERGKTIAAVIIEPVVGNMGVIVPKPGYLQGIHDLCKQHGALFIVDEVMTGFRLGTGGACGLYGMRPGPRHLRQGDRRRPAGGRLRRPRRRDGPGGAGRAHLPGRHALREPDGHGRRHRHAQAHDPGRLRAARGPRARSLADGLAAEAAARPACEVQVNRVGSMLTVFFTVDAGLRRRHGARKASAKRFGAFFHTLLENGVYFPPSQFEAAFLSTAHSEADLELTLRAAAAGLRRGGQDPGLIRRTDGGLGPLAPRRPRGCGALTDHVHLLYGRALRLSRTVGRPW